MSRVERLSFSIGESSRLRPAETAPSDQPAGSGSRRRVADAIYEAFALAMSRGDIATAEDLLNAMQGSYDRARIRAAGDRRRSDPLIERARTALEAKKAARYRRY